MSDGLKSLESTLRTTFAGAVDLWVTRQAESWMASIAGVFGSLFLYTPPMRNPDVPWIWTWWNYAFLFSLLIHGAALLWHGFRLLRPDTDGKHRLSSRFFVVLVAVVGSYLSLYLIDVGIYLQNYVWSGLLGELLHWSAENAARPDSASVLALVFGGSGRSVSGLVSGMGLLPGILPVILASLMALVALARQLLLILLAVASPVYVAFTGFAADPSPLVGCVTVCLRTLLVQSLFGAAWLVLAFVQSGALGFMGFPTGFLVSCVLAFALIGAWLWWLKPVGKALAHPLTLGGAAVLTAIGAVGEKAGALLGMVGAVTAQPELAAAGTTVREASRRAAATGSSLRDPAETLRQRVSSLLPASPERHEPGPLHTRRTHVDDQGQSWAAFRVPPASEGRVLEALAEANVTTEAHGGELLVLPSQAQAVEKIITGVFRDVVPYWRYSDRYVVIREGIPAVINAPPQRGVEMGTWNGHW